MWGKYAIPGLALVGLFISLGVVYRGQRKPTVAPILFEPASPPYRAYIAAEGIIEAQSKNINVSVFFPQLIMEVYHRVGDTVKKGDPLLKLDTRRLEAELTKALKDQEVAQKEYEKLRNQYSYYSRLKEKAAVSEQSYAAAKYDAELAQNRLAAAQAAVVVIKTDIERSTTRAPRDGTILQINALVGEFANVNPFNGLPLILLGNTEYFHVRIDIDEVEAWRYTNGSAATAFLRGNTRIRIPLEFVHIEPYIVPKKSLTGVNTERVDTRVFQVIYRFKQHDYPVYAGQLLDIFIEAQPARRS